MYIAFFIARRHFPKDKQERFCAPLNRPGDTLTVIEWQALNVVALHQANKREEAQIAVVRLLALTESAGAIRVYLDEGEPMRQALQSELYTSSDQQEDKGALSRSYVSRLLAAFEQEEQKRAVPAEDQPVRRDGSAPSTPPLLEPLTAQEQRVLHLLAAGRSTHEIAQTLVVSINTVKTQLKHLYSKLQESSRTQASAVARERQLL